MASSDRLLHHRTRHQFSFRVGFDQLLEESAGLAAARRRLFLADPPLQLPLTTGAHGGNHLGGYSLADDARSARLTVQALAARPVIPALVAKRPATILAVLEIRQKPRQAQQPVVEVEKRPVHLPRVLQAAKHRQE